MNQIMTEHTAKAFDADLQEITRKVAEMGGLAEREVADSIEALTKRDLELAKSVVTSDPIIDRLQHEIEEKAILLIARRQPMARDLREVVAAIRIAADLERVGDLAKNIGKRVIAIQGQFQPQSLVHGVQHLAELRAGRAVECPQYDFSTHTRKAATRSVRPSRIVAVEGILLFAIPELRDAFDLRIFVDTDDDIRLMRRIQRDLVERQRDITSVEHQYFGTVRPMHLLHVAPSKRFAHLIVPEGGENAEALDVIVGRLKYLLATG